MPHNVAANMGSSSSWQKVPMAKTLPFKWGGPWSIATLMLGPDPQAYIMVTFWAKLAVIHVFVHYLLYQIVFPVLQLDRQALNKTYHRQRT